MDDGVGGHEFFKFYPYYLCNRCSWVWFLEGGNDKCPKCSSDECGFRIYEGKMKSDYKDFIISQKSWLYGNVLSNEEIKEGLEFAKYSYELEHTL